MNTITNWFNRFTATTHFTFASVLALAGALYAAYWNVPQVQTLSQHIYAAVPGWAQLVIAAAVGWYAWYRNGEKPVANHPTDVDLSAGTPTTASATAKKTVAILAAVLCLNAVTAKAQTPAAAPEPASPAGFVPASDVMVIRCNGSSGAGNLTTEAYDAFDYGGTKSNRVFAQGVELSAPSCGLSVYGAGLLWQPDISALLKKTNIPTGNLLFFLDGSAGNGIPATGSNRVSAVIGGGFKYILSDNLTWNTIRFEEVFFGNQRYPAVSTGLSAYFGGTPASAAASPNVKRSLMKRLASAAAHGIH
jgi:hypothetical protein